MYRSLPQSGLFRKRILLDEHTLSRGDMVLQTGKGMKGASQLPALVRSLANIRGSMLELESGIDIEQFGSRRQSARNLLHYIALRRQDIRLIQERLADMGLSSLGRSESHVLYNLNSVLTVAQSLAGADVSEGLSVGEVTPSQGSGILKRNADSLFGPAEQGRSVRIMATMPTEAASSYALVRDLVAEGMDCMRINCAHDTQKDWLSMVDNLRRAEKEVGRKCRILMDISGPRIRTGKLEPGPQVLRLRPRRDPYGRILAPARVFLRAAIPDSTSTEGVVPILLVQAAWLQWLEDGMSVEFRDARDSLRSMTISIRRKGEVVGELSKTAYLDPTTRLTHSKGGKRRSTTILNIPCQENPIELKVGDKLVVTSADEPGTPAERGEPARISCTLPEALAFAKPGQRIWLDDGKIGGLIRSASSGELLIDITHAAFDGTRLREDKGINLPDSDLKLPPLTAKDLEDLRFIAGHADLVGYSFVRRPSDLRALRAELTKLGRKDLGVVLKIETRRAFEQLPSLLLEALRGPVSGVMIARGDLAVECGFERLAEVQEEILWMCEAAHMPTIWATQVLEGLTKSGIPSRAEVSDAAMGQRSECVMLNKGPHMVEALKALDGILRRMQAHQVKKSSMMRQLSIADSFFKTVTAD